MLRRNFLPALAALPVSRSFAAPKPPVRMKITAVRVVRLKVIRDAGSLEPAWNPGGKMRFQVGGGSFVEVHSDQGLVGIGPGMQPDLLPAIEAQLLGKDPFDMQTNSAHLKYYASGPSYRGSAGVDIALWDLIGKACGQPLYKLWGGGKDRVPAYASMIQLSSPEERARMAEQLLAEGWTAIKLRLHHPTMRDDIRTVELVRKAVGDRMEIMTDANQAQSFDGWQPGVAWTFERAAETARKLQELRCYWLEEPLPRYSWNRLAELNRLVEIPIAGGENNRGLHEFLGLLRDDVFDIVQPECMVLDGVTTPRKIGVLAEAFGKRIVPHHGGGDLGTIAHLHLIASWPHSPYIELLHDPPIGSYQQRFSIMSNAPVVDKQGFMALPQGPGLGVEIRRDWIV
jgi:L-alanine-DL-glutamate epimerase-like enolase superfamily enzyme